MNNGNMTFIRETIERRSGIALDEDKAYLIENRLEAIVESSEYPDLDSLINQLRLNQEDGLWSRLIEALTTNETSFFRDLHPFFALERDILPKMIEAREEDRQLRILSAGCSSGQETFSIAMAIDAGFPQLTDWTVDILGVDISPEMIDRCQTGVYKQLEVQRGLPAIKLLKYFKQDGLTFSINEQLKTMTRFEQRNIVDAWPSGERFDIIFLRNVLIYFSQEGQKTVLHNIREHLAPDGYLLLGVENAAELDDSFQRETIGQATVYRLRP
ncbi:MAG TPA: chemotaxis protein CheR [Deltaproteobacteria bacterium]|nr:chemotaxis protein CheR [Deltaproteobacteria bacterium]HCP46072.1 chemotaxis protein CheR [Deltaproteobacteria bacterium]|tara:strand:+ start:214 stop:1026 length:813 start_codon:yes stop_codon:yes gene_type:complete